MNKNQKHSHLFTPYITLYIYYNVKTIYEERQLIRYFYLPGLAEANAIKSPREIFFHSFFFEFNSLQLVVTLIENLASQNVTSIHFTNIGNIAYKNIRILS